MQDLVQFFPTAVNAANDFIINSDTLRQISFKGFLSLLGLIILFVVLITEKVDKTIVSILIAGLLIFFQVFTGPDELKTSQEVATGFIYHNLDIFGFIIGMMIMTGLVADSGIFTFLALKLVNKVKGHPIKLFIIFSYMSFFMTVFISNIPTIIILAPVIVIVCSSLKLPSLPFIIGIITFANLGGAVTSISDPTTYYQATTLGFSFIEVLTNTGLIMFICTFSSILYLYLVFRNDLKTKPNFKALDHIDYYTYLKSQKSIIISLLILVTVIILIIFKDYILENTGIRFDNGTITLFGAFLAILFLKQDVGQVLKTKVNYATLFFFAGLFIVIGAIEYNGLIILLADKLVESTGGNDSYLLMIMTMGSAILSVFIDNVPYNIAMVGTLEQFQSSGLVVGSTWYALAWGLNSCTSIGGAGSPIGAACNVIALGEVEEDGIVIKFLKYLIIGVPLVMINSYIAYLILDFRYL